MPKTEKYKKLTFVCNLFLVSNHYYYLLRVKYIHTYQDTCVTQ
jgi:hypothetical protein